MKTSGFWKNIFKTLFVLFAFIYLAFIVPVIFVPYFGSDIPQKARRAAAAAKISVIDKAIEDFKVGAGHYPDVKTWREDLLSSSTAGLGGMGRGPYLIKAMGLDPWGRDYRYIYPGMFNTRGFDLVSAGADGKFGTKDDVTNYEDKHKHEPAEAGNLY